MCPSNTQVRESPCLTYLDVVPGAAIWWGWGYPSEKSCVSTEAELCHPLFRVKFPNMGLYLLSYWELPSRLQTYLAQSQQASLGKAEVILRALNSRIGGKMWGRWLCSLPFSTLPLPDPRGH